MPVPDGSGFGRFLGRQSLGDSFENRPLPFDQGRANRCGGGFFPDGQLSSRHLEYSVGKRGDLVTMGDGEDGEFPFVPKFLKDFENFFLGQGIEIAGGFI